jgi:HlyD family secretion protein
VTRRPSLVAVSGADMDVIVPRKRRSLPVIAVAVVAVGVGVILFLNAIPSGLRVPAKDVRVATVQPGVFKDDIIVRANIEPAVSVILDAVESGRVEEVATKDGSMVKAGDLLFRLSNPQRRLDLLARQSDLAQQFSNFISMQVQYETAKSDYRRRLTDLRNALTRAQKQYNRMVQLSAQGYIPRTTLADAGDDLEQDKSKLREEEKSQSEELRTKHGALIQMQEAISGIRSGVDVVAASIEALAVRSPIDGRVTNFALQVGALVKQGDRVGRVDDPLQFKLVAQVDEFYLDRVQLGQHAVVIFEGQPRGVAVTRINPQVKDGRFSVELVFQGGAPPGLHAGQSMDCRLTLGQPLPALLVENGAFVNETGGSWAFVLGPNGRTAQRRALRIGRRNSEQLEILGGVRAGERVIVSSYSAFGKSERLILEN